MSLEFHLGMVEVAKARENRFGYDAFNFIGRQMCIELMIDAEFHARLGDHIAQRLFVQIGSLMPHLINVEDV